MTEEKYTKLKDNLEEEFSRLSFPLYNPMEMASDLSDGSDTVFLGDEVEYPASKFATHLRKHLKDCPNEGFPYEDSDSLVQDTIAAMRKEGVLED